MPTGAYVTKAQMPLGMGISLNLTTYCEWQKAAKLILSPHFSSAALVKAADIQQGEQLLKPF